MYSLPIKRKDLLNINLIIGFIQIIVPYTIIYASSNGEPKQVVKQYNVGDADNPSYIKSGANWWYEYSYEMDSNITWKQFVEQRSEEEENKTRSDRGVDDNIMSRGNFSSSGMELENIRDSHITYLKVRKVYSSILKTTVYNEDNPNHKTYNYQSFEIKYDTTAPVIRVQKVDKTNSNILSDESVSSVDKISYVYIYIY